MHAKNTTSRTQTKRGFTLIELLVSVLVVGALLALLIVGLQAGGVFARKAASQQTLSSIKQGVVLFETEVGFKVPLVYDGREMGGFSATSRGAFSNEGPTYSGAANRPLVNVYRLGQAQTRSFLRGEFLNAGATPDYRDARYSKFSLSMYLTGYLGPEFDGVDGLGMRKPSADGTWSGIGEAFGGSNQTYEPFMDTGRRSARLEAAYVDVLEQREHGGSAPASTADRTALVDGNGRAYRFYRWLADDGASNTNELNIPAVLLDPITAESALNDPSIDVTEGDVQLRSATWAVVSAGGDGLFGSEDIADLREKVNARSGAADAELRRAARKDNVVEVGP